MSIALNVRARVPAARWQLHLLLLSALALFLIACGESSPEPPVTRSREVPVYSAQDLPPPTDVPQIVEPSATPIPLPKVMPTDTALPATAEQPPTPMHVVAAGETLTSISDLYGVSTEALLSLNDISDPNLIHNGQILVVPQAGGDVTEVPPFGTAVSLLVPTPVGGRSQDQSPTPSTAEPLAGEDVLLPNGVPCPEGEVTVPQGAVIIGRSAGCNIPIVSYQVGSGPKQVILVGGIHGGYEWNTTLLAYAMLDYLAKNPDSVPESITVHIIPNANPDGLYLVTQKTGLFSQADIAADTVPGRFNGNNVDLNRNWDCKWVQEAYWRDQLVDAGSAPLSEPENQALLNFIEPKSPELVLFWHSSANQVIPGGCGAPGPRGSELATVFARASNYPYAVEFVGDYPVTGDAGDSLSLRSIANFTVEMTSHHALDFDRNRDGLLALLRYIDTGGEGNE